MKDNNVTALAEKVEAHYDADVIIYFGEIARKWDDHLIDVCKERIKRKNVLLILTTYGGDAHPAFRIARCLQQNYHTGQGDGQVIIYVPSICASAGTLITLAADRLILSDHAELGPLDVQLRKADEIGERISGLTPIQALSFLEKETSKFYRAQFLGLRFSETFTFSTRMAADIAAELASGLLSHLYEQIDPLRLAEYDRTNRIAEHYGNRIKTPNVKPDTIKRLLEEYPSHECCIDPVEAKELFKKIETPNKDLENLGNTLKFAADKFLSSSETAVVYLTDPKPKPEDKTNEKGTDDNGNKSGGNAGTGHNGEATEGQGPQAGPAGQPEHATSVAASRP